MWQAYACHTKQICSELKFKCSNSSLTYSSYIYYIVMFVTSSVLVVDKELSCFRCLDGTLFVHPVVHSQKHASCIKSAAGLLPCSHQADIRMRSMLLQLDDNKSTANCQHA